MEPLANVKQSAEIDASAESETENSQQTGTVIHIKMCKCGRAPHRKAQSPNVTPPRNCHFCHKEANQKYRRSVKRQVAELKATVSRLLGRA